MIPQRMEDISSRTIHCTEFLKKPFTQREQTF